MKKSLGILKTVSIGFIGFIGVSSFVLCAHGQERGSFFETTHLPEVSSPGFEAKPDISDDKLTLLIASDRPGGQGELDLWASVRRDLHSDWTAPIAVTELNSTGRDHTPTTSGDGLIIIFSSSRLGGPGSDDAWISTRARVNSPWNPPQLLANINSPERDMGFSMTPDGLILYFSSNRGGGPGGFDLYMTSRPDTASDFAPPVLIDELNTPFDEKFPTVTGDNLSLYFPSNRPGSVLDSGGQPSPDIWVGMRTSASAPWSVIENVYELNTEYQEYLITISNDHSEMYFVSDRPGSLGSFDVYGTRAIPRVARYGTGLEGEAGITRLRPVGGEPVIGNSRWSYEVLNVPPDATAYLWTSFEADVGPQIWVGTPIFLQLFQIPDPSNPPADVPRIIHRPIPDSRGLCDLTVYYQVILVCPDGEGQVGSTNFAASPGLRITVGC